jgi:hypothetical protein
MFGAVNQSGDIPPADPFQVLGGVGQDERDAPMP